MRWYLALELRGRGVGGGYEHVYRAAYLALLHCYGGYGMVEEKKIVPRWARLMLRLFTISRRRSRWDSTTLRWVSREIPCGIKG